MATSIESLKAMIEPMRAAIKLQTEQLTVLEKQLWELENPVETRPFSVAEMERRVIALEKRKTYKNAWKKAVDDGLIRFIGYILNDCYPAWEDEDGRNEVMNAAFKKLGKIGSRHWQIFTLKIIEYLHKNRRFRYEDGRFDTFEDTAGGCDETTWDAGCYLLENPAWMESPTWLE
jgi:hypothetical protein